MGDVPSVRPGGDGPAGASGAELRAVVENIDEGLVIADAHGRVVTINQRAREMIGIQPEYGAWGGHISDFPRHLEILTLDGRKLDPHERPMAKVMAGEHFSNYELRCRRIETGVEWVASFVGTPVRAADGSVELAVLSARDITDRMRVEEALHLAAREKDAFIATLAHELRNPLAPILAAAELLARDENQDSRRHGLSEIIARQARHLSRIVDDLLDVSRITSGRIVLDRETLDLGKLVRQTAEDVRPAFEAAAIDLTVQVPPVSAWVVADPTRLAQVVENLLSNALKFTDAGGRVDVVLATGEPERSARIVVRDTGMGIDATLQQRLWEPFTQGETPPRHRSVGLGLGMTLVKSLAEMHGGQVTLFSEGPGRGSEFTVTIPIVDAPTPGETPPADRPAMNRKGTPVLVIEDDEDVAATLVEVVRELGCEIRVASNGADGIRVAEEWRPAVVLCDLGLPGEIDGYQVAESLRGARYAGMLVALTGFGRPEDRQRAMAAGFDRHVTKPVGIREIEDLITAAMR